MCYPLKFYNKSNGYLFVGINRVPGEVGFGTVLQLKIVNYVS